MTLRPAVPLLLLFLGMTLLPSGHGTTAEPGFVGPMPPLGARVDCIDLPMPPTAEDGIIPPVTCSGIRPGARMTSPAGCTLNFVVTDGTELYIGTAGHCVTRGDRVAVQGIGFMGTVVTDSAGGGDYAFIRVDPEDRAHVDPSMCRFGGPYALVDGDGVREPVPGEPVVHYGHGVAAGSVEATRGRAAATVLPWWFYGYEFPFVASAAGGDSGSPVRAASGEAIGILVAHYRLPGYPYTSFAPSLTIATRFDVALENFETDLGRPVWLVPDPSLPL